MTDRQYPYNLPIWRTSHRTVSPDGKLIAQINPAREVAMSAPTFGILCVSNGLHVERCNPSFVWSDDSRYLAVPQFYMRLGLIKRQRLIVIDFQRPFVHISKSSEYFYQPESFAGGELIVSINPAHGKRQVTFRIPDDLNERFTRAWWMGWPEIPGVTPHVVMPNREI